MATKKFTRGARSAQFDALREHVEQQRSRLMEAEAVLDCLSCAIEGDVRLEAPNGPSYPEVVRIVCELVRSSIDRLDSVNLDAVLTRDVSAETSVGEGKYGGVKEVAEAYVH